MYCASCGKELLASVKYCPNCGAGVTSGAPVTAPATFRTDVSRYAGFWRRCAASFLDSLIVTVFGLAVVLLALALGAKSETLLGWYSLVSWVFAWLYTSLFHSSNWQATPGKRAMGVKVTTLDGARIGFGRATGRFFASILSSLTLFIGYFMAGFTARKQALHDLIAGTLVVSENATPADFVGDHLFEPRVTGGVVAVCVVVGFVPAIVGILAAISIPAYQDYMIRSQVAEGLVSASPYKVAIAEALATSNDPTVVDNEHIGISPNANPSTYVSSFDVFNSVIQITYGPNAHAKLQGRSVALIPGLTAAGGVVWTCGHRGVAEGVAAVIDSYDEYTDIEPKYLPSNCR